ncbi:protein SCO1/2 [Gracilibacillus halotolerans]|uniref:Protein SCO1/2 n=1 Tax=Gracilibacillus halotolerans TaxID=74386 RepID=A0A841RJC7_9BACI|nr:SCO family protein [Gracilibacillus halotolerans]MBB6511295.1 protein SCO1/2 [Gracilibacillus halotolerans]
MRKLVLLFTGLALFLVACSNSGIEEHFSIEVQDFAYTDQDGNTFEKSELDGEVWIASMIFTNCTTVCPPMTANKVRLQQALADADVEVELVSFSVDPTIDTPELLTEYITERGGSFDNWHALTGYTDQEIKDFAAKSFKTLVEKPDGTDQVIHTTSFYLVNKDGYAIKGYNGTKAEEMQDIVEDVKKLN